MFTIGGRSYCCLLFAVNCIVNTEYASDKKDNCLCNLQYLFKFITKNCILNSNIVARRHVDPLLGKNREIKSYTTAVTRQWPPQIHNTHQWSNWEAVFSAPSCIGTAWNAQNKMPTVD
jgi:hypothetical protein